MVTLSKKSSLLLLAKYLKNYKLRFFGIFIALSFAAISFLSIGIAIREIINYGFAEHNISALNETIMLLFGIATILAFASSIRAYLIDSTAELIISDIRHDIYQKLLHTSIYYFEMSRVSDIVSRLVNDIQVIQSLINTIFSFFTRNALIIIFGISLLLYTSVKLSVYMVMLFPIVIIPVVVLGRRVKFLSAQSQVYVGLVSGCAEETLSAIKTVKSYNRHAHEISRFHEILMGYSGCSIQRIRYKSYLVAMMIWMVSGVTAVLIWLGGRMVLGSSMSSGELVSFIFYAVVVASAIGGMSEVVSEINKASGIADRIVELLKLHAEQVSHPATQEINLSKNYTIKFKDIGFSYPARPTIKVLEKFSMAIKKGEKVALTGGSGSGKSTIFQLLLKFYDLREGGIFINDTNIKELDNGKLRESIGFVSQDTFIFSASAYDNIAYGKLGSTEEQVMHAAKLANIHDFIESLPKKYDTFLGERGVALSGGQKQRIAIARAILKDPEILLLDEATSNLDSANETLVQSALNYLMVGRTTIVISHRSSVIEACDRIYNINLNS